MKKIICEFAQQEIKFLEHILGQGHLRMDPKEVQVIVEQEALTKVIELGFFLRLANYYRKFIKECSKMVTPLIDLLKRMEVSPN